MSEFKGHPVQSLHKNILVIGDLIVDHDIFVRAKAVPEGSDSSERQYDVLWRQDTAGGAANSARILSILNNGVTFLWGVLGRSHWGSFREILEKSHAIDGARRPVQLRGVKDETDAPIDTVTRLLLVNDSDSRLIHRETRFYDTNQIAISPHSRDSLMDHLAQIHLDKACVLDAIVINDFEKQCLTKRLLKEISIFAQEQRIPLFLDPRRDRTRYDEIVKGTAIFPNLIEWCHLVEQSNHVTRWRRNLHNEAALQEMATLSLRYLPQFRYYIIKCDSDGSIMIGPSRERAYMANVYHFRKEVTVGREGGDQLGCGDIMTAVFALSYESGKYEADDFDNVWRSMQLANAAVAGYRAMPWHRMPSLDVVQSWHSAMSETVEKPLASVSLAAKLLPTSRVTSMAKMALPVAGLYGKSQEYRSTIEEFLIEIASSGTRSVVLGAPPTSGKSTIRRFLRDTFGKQKGLDIIDATDEFGRMTRTRPREICEQLLARHNENQRLVVLVDEAMKPHARRYLHQEGVMLLDTAASLGMRFAFIGAEFSREMEDSSEWHEFMSRCRCFYLPGLSVRTDDIPYIIAAAFERKVGKIRRLEIDESVLLELMADVLKNLNSREIEKRVENVVRDKKMAKLTADSLVVRRPARRGEATEKSVERSVQRVFDFSEDVSA